MRLEDLGLIGNCQFSALVERTGAVVWSCLPRFDSEPIFAKLLDKDDGGHFLVGPADGSHGTQRYLDNTNVLETTFATADGGIRVLDFAPRFEQHGRTFRPTQLIRVVEPVQGTPRARIQCDPCLGWSKQKPVRLFGSNHISFEGFPVPLRLTIDIPISYLAGQPFALTERHYLILSWGTPVEESLAPLCERFLHETTQYWQRWVKECDVPPHYQQEVIRSALALKLHCFEDTGAIVAAMTTSIPESPGSQRTWDYRYCWLRDAYYALSAFRLVGHFEERERFVRFLINIASASPELELAPLYRGLRRRRPTHVGKFSTGLFACGHDPRGVRGVSTLVGSAVGPWRLERCLTLPRWHSTVALALHRQIVDAPRSIAARESREMPARLLRQTGCRC